MRPLLPPRRPPRPELSALLRAAAFAAALAAAPSSVSAKDPAVVPIGGIDYVRLDDGAAALGLKFVRSIPDTTVILKSGAQPVARLSDHSREIDMYGLRVFLGDPVIERSGVFYVSRIDYRARIVPRLRPDLCDAPPMPPRVIAIDPGHGGVDHGAENHAMATMEKTYTLDVSLRLRKLLEGAGYKVVLTRDADYDLPKPLRSELANRAGADLFISVHFNSLYPNTKTMGAEVFSFSPRSQRSTESWSLGGKNDAESKAAAVNAFDPWSTVLASAAHRGVIGALRDGDRGEKIAHFGVLRDLKCPGILVESAIISSDVEAGKLATPAFRDKIAAGIFAGIQDYAAILKALRPPAVEAPASPGKPSVAPAGAAPAPRAPPSRPSQGT